MLYVGHRGLMVDILISGDFVDLCGSALGRVCMALYGTQGPSEVMNRFVGSLVACSFEMRSRLAGDALSRR
ncbi:unnamed protein product [Brassica oleracea]